MRSKGHMMRGPYFFVWASKGKVVLKIAQTALSALTIVATLSTHSVGAKDAQPKKKPHCYDQCIGPGEFGCNEWKRVCKKT